MNNHRKAGFIILLAIFFYGFIFVQGINSEDDPTIEDLVEKAEAYRANADQIINSVDLNSKREEAEDEISRAKTMILTTEVFRFIEQANLVFGKAEQAMNDAKIAQKILEEETEKVAVASKAVDAETIEENTNQALQEIQKKVNEAQDYYESAINFAKEAINAAETENARRNIEKIIQIIIFVLIFIALILLFIRTIIFSKKINKIADKLEIYVGSFESKISELENNYTSLSKSVNNILADYHNTSLTLIKEYDYEKRIKNIEKQIYNHTEQINKIDKATAGDQAVYDGIKRDGVNPVDVVSIFNIWASNPSISLPSAFFYVTGEPKRRTTQIFNESPQGIATKWIINRNRSGNDRKYLFPNPNFFDDQTDISGLYLMDTGRLKPKGLNKIKIIEACEIVEDGFIRFQGKLDLL